MKCRRAVPNYLVFNAARMTDGCVMWVYYKIVLDGAGNNLLPAERKWIPGRGVWWQGGEVWGEIWEIFQIFD